ncbi:hypothetical protein LF1_25750 [Rubripirellula obstinata]|uniref:Uncharacterized protein n=1 Tax=Rubripirellula obstinata TaxID=406547 RepID=A0A5B1CFR0_9BACT|nr:hypothetical protein [Rubripirellula obstinata]KAA1260037.1 hypothetical protein LF1_25750 [Rubripirellula obstinata]
MKNFIFVFAIAMCSTAVCCTAGCGDDSGTKSIYDEDEMAKYRQTPEELRQGMLEAQKASRNRGKEIAKEMRKAGSS